MVVKYTYMVGVYIIVVVKCIFMVVLVTTNKRVWFI